MIEETVEAGMVLTGSEVKSLRAGGANLSDAYAQVRGTEIFLHKAHIAPYMPPVSSIYDQTQPAGGLSGRPEI